MESCELLWTTGYWGWSDGVYIFNDGYWGPQIGFYGGVAYGFGYTGDGYEGGYWCNGSFFYNQSVNNISGVSITNVWLRSHHAWCPDQRCRYVRERLV